MTFCKNLNVSLLEFGGLSPLLSRGKYKGLKCCSLKDKLLYFKDVKCWWEKSKVTFDGQTVEATLGSEVRLRLINESAGEGK